MTDEIEAVKETAKAAQEIARTAGKAIDASEKFGGFISRFISGSFEQGIGIFEDKLKYMRWERQQRLMRRAEDFMASQGLKEPTKPISLKLAIPLLQAASLEEDNHLQDLWAKLLVNAVNISKGLDLKRVYIDILERLTPIEVRILERIYSLPFEETQYSGILTVNLPEEVSIADDESREEGQPADEVKLALSSLSMLNCLYLPRSVGGGEIFTWVNPTLLGKNFVEACTLQKTPR